ncbi:MAG TPA: bifunctional homocysteine S-methyltransferase/methylenetetrahydrofolate reductase [Candidatus Saccharimonadales bacterium]|nr:bifunctional homocysteine S-methyltransferase/methylenetetrahydrofolate reductase [Candidatus Saccharimonadales bacterium]
MKIQDFNERLKDSILIADGAMGSMLHDVVGAVRCFDELNVTEPEAVFRVHQAYIEAGAQIIETNTFGANRFKLAPLGLGDDVQRLNSRGVKVAREARESASREVLIAGSMGPLGIGVQARHPEPEQIRAIFHEQALALEERGVDLFILETFSYIEELQLAIDAIRSFSALPIIAQLTYSEEGTTYGDMRPFVTTAMLKDKNVQVIGANCTLGPQSLLPILQEISNAADTAVSGMPNAGFPKREGDRIVYPKSSPEYFAEFAREAAAMGVRILGGCCGTAPAHIRAMAEAVKSLRPAKTQASSVVVATTQPTAAISEREPESNLWKKLQKKEFVVSVEIDPPKGISLERIYEQVDKVMASKKVDAIDINSGAMARVGMDALIVAGALEARGVETVPHLTTRDQNIIGLQAMLLGAWTVGGVRNVLGITGDPPSVGDYPEASGVYEVDSVGLTKILHRLNQGTDWAGKTLGGQTNFTIGVALNPMADDLETEIARFHAKVEAGAHFAMTQPLFDPAHWHAFLKKLGGKPPIPVLIGVWPLNSYKQALRLNNEVPGIVIPEPLLKSMEAAGAAARERGFEVAREMLAWARTELAGAYLIPPFKRYEEILEVL